MKFTIKICISILLLTHVASSASSQKLNLQPSFTALTVKNIDKSIEWYSKAFDLKLRNRVDNEARGFKQAVLIDKGIMIELVELIKVVSPDSLLKSQPGGTQILGYYKFGFTVPNIDSLFKKFVAMSLAFHGKMVVDPENNKKTFIVSDPDGNLVQFFEE